MPNFRRFIFLILILACFILQSFSQVWTTNNLPRFRQGNDIVLLPSYKTVVVGGHETNDPITGIYRSADTARSWDLISDIPLSPWLTSVCFTSELKGITCGNGGMVQRTFDGGQNWNRLSLPATVTTRNYTSLFFVSGTIGFMVGGKRTNDSVRTILKTSDGGSNWEILLDEQGAWLRSVFFINDQVGFVTGDMGTLMKTTNGGTTWNPVSLPANIGTRQLNAIVFTNATQGIIMGGFPSKDSIQTILRTENGGADWSVISDGKGPMLNDVSFPTETTGYAVGDYGTVLKTEDGGKSWSHVSIPTEINDSRSLYGVDFYDRFYGVAVGQSGKVLVYQDSSGKKPYMDKQSIRLLGKGSVQIDALVHPNSLPTHVVLQYGITSAMLEINDFGSGYSGDEGIPVSITLQGLSDHLLYYYRFLCENEAGLFSSESKTFLAGYDIPNWSFEEWDTLKTESLEGWKTGGVQLKVTGMDGSDAVEMHANKQGPGALLLGDYTGSAFIKGAPFTAMPDSIIAFMKYDIASGDSANILLILKKNSVPIVDTMFKFTGSSGGVFTRLSFGIHPLSEENPDSIIIGVLSTNYFAGTLDSNSIMTVDSLGFANTNQSFPNAGFGNWNDNMHFLPRYWYASDQFISPQVIYVTSVSDNKFNGDYALKLSNVPTEKGVMNGNLATGKNFNGPSFPVNARYDSLFVFLQFYPASQDTLQISLQLFMDGNPIGFGHLELNETISKYKHFSIPIQYNQPGTPDSALLSFHLTSFDKNSAATWALIDALTFDALSVIVPSLESQPSVRSYPCPADKILNIRLAHSSSISFRLQLFDLSGRSVCILNPLFNGLDYSSYNVSILPGGMYLARVMDESGNPVSSSFKVLINH